jgi:hypothetical protein
MSLSHLNARHKSRRASFVRPRAPVLQQQIKRPDCLRPGCIFPAPVVFSFGAMQNPLFPRSMRNAPDLSANISFQPPGTITGPERVGGLSEETGVTGQPPGLFCCRSIRSRSTRGTRSSSCTTFAQIVAVAPRGSVSTDRLRLGLASPFHSLSDEFRYEPVEEFLSLQVRLRVRGPRDRSAPLPLPPVSLRRKIDGRIRAGR